MLTPPLNFIRAALFCCLLFLAPSVALADSNAKANRLFVEGVQLYRQAENAPLEERYELYRQVRDNIDMIVEEHPSSDLAVRIVLGEPLGPIDLAELARLLNRFHPDSLAVISAPGPLQEDVIVLLPKGVGPTDTARLLVLHGAIDDKFYSEFLFQLRERNQRDGRAILYGEYLIRAGASMEEILELVIGAPFDHD